MTQQAANSRAPGQESTAPAGTPSDPAPFQHAASHNSASTRRTAPSATAHPARGRARARRIWEDAARAVASRWDILAVIAAGGALGSLARWGLAVALPHPPGAFPWATFTANVTGSLLIGALMVLISDVWPPSKYLRPFLGVGLLGGYTTFSTYMLDTRTLLVTGHTATAGAYLVGSLAAGLAAVWAGAVAVKLAIHARRQHSLRGGGPSNDKSTTPNTACEPALPRRASAGPSSPPAGPPAGSSGTGDPS